MKAILISAALIAPVIALAADDKTKNQTKAETKADIRDAQKDARDAVKKATGGTAAKTEALSQSELLNKLHKVSVSHTEMGNLAQTHAKSDKVMKLGEKMAKDFTDVDQKVIGYAKDNNIVLSDAVGMMKDKAKAGAKNEWADLGKLQGEAFDEKFLSATIDGCQRFVSTLEAAKGKYDMGFDRVLESAIDTFKSYEKAATDLQKNYAPAT